MECALFSDSSSVLALTFCKAIAAGQRFCLRLQMKIQNELPPAFASLQFDFYSPQHNMPDGANRQLVSEYRRTPVRSNIFGWANRRRLFSQTAERKRRDRLALMRIGRL